MKRHIIAAIFSLLAMPPLAAEYGGPWELVHEPEKPAEQPGEGRETGSVPVLPVER